jgi:hypothetical protein
LLVSLHQVFVIEDQHDPVVGFCLQSKECSHCHDPGFALTRSNLPDLLLLLVGDTNGILGSSELPLIGSIGSHGMDEFSNEARLEP